jgi:hypothetical protein
MKHCRRVVAPPEVLVPRLVRLKELFAGLPDAKTRSIFFSAKAEQRWRAFLDHAVRGCISDPDPQVVPLYFIAGWSRAGLPIYGCSRGTVDLEGYHQKIESLLEGYRVGPEHSDAVLREFNFRWNLAMEAKYLGLHGDLRGFFELERVDAIQTATDGWWEEPVYAMHRHTETYADTGEHFGLIDLPEAGGEGGDGLPAVVPMVEDEAAALREEAEEEEEEEQEEEEQGAEGDAEEEEGGARLE